MLAGLQLLSAASPGPDFMIVTKYAVSQGRNWALVCSLGIASALAVHIFLAATGVSFLIANSAVLLTVFKTISISYLTFIGLKSLLSTRKNEEKSILTRNNKMPFAIGFLSNITNPRTPIYFLAIFTSVIGTNAGYNTLFLFGCVMVAMQLLWFSLVSVAFTHHRISSYIQQNARYLDIGFGISMLIFAAIVATSLF